MLVPLSWIKEFAEIPDSVSAEEISDALIRVGFEVEEIRHEGRDLQGPLVVGRVVEIEELLGHKKPIRWVELDCGEGQTRFVICGATNFSPSDLVVVALPGAQLPGNFVISQRETYGKTSNGMICSVKELGLGQDHSGILVLPDGSASVGADAIELLEISEVVFDIAINPDRGYALSLRGISREVAAALGVPYRDPVEKVDISALENSTVDSSGTNKVGVSIDDPTAASVIHIRTLSEFNSKSHSPLWMRRRLEKCGMRSISLAVDVTNYVMLELGQPLHAFDRDVIAGDLHIRRAGKGATLTTLDGQSRILNEDDLLVADIEKPLALAGTMGGSDSEVTSETTNLAIEAARFDPASISRNARRHKLFSEASKRFERGVDPSLAAIASARAIALLVAHGGGRYVGGSSAGEPRYSPIVEFDSTVASQLVGIDISADVAKEKLLQIGCDIDDSDPKSWKVDPPSWRGDLTTPADFVEEIIRMVGFDVIPTILPPHPASPGLTSRQLRQREVGKLLANRGLVEVQTYPFLSQDTMNIMGFSGERAAAFRITNPMSEDAPLLRTHLLPGLVQTAARNIGRGARNFGIFEIGSVFRNSKNLPLITNPSAEKRPSAEDVAAIYSTVPVQPIHVGGLLVGQAEEDGWYGKGRDFMWSDALSHVESILAACNLNWTVKRSDFAPWHPGRCSEYLIGETVVAHAGELHPRVIESFGLPARSSAFVLNLTALPERELIKGTLLGVMPVAVQDIALIVDENVSASSVEEALIEGAGDYLESIQLFDRYEGMGGGKISLGFTLTFRAPDRTFTSSEVAEFRESATESARRRTGAILRSA